jgi:alpha-L-rhamnosidase
VRIEAPGIDVDEASLCGVVLHSDLEETGDFSCSHPGIDQLQRNIRWSQKGNFLEVPSDCPQREKMGWTGDIQIYAPTACFVMDSAGFLTKNVGIRK